MLLDVLLNNLLSNAIKHNVAGGRVSITLRDRTLTVGNTGLPMVGNDTERLFERFGKGDADNQSLGLGLSIVREICKRYGYRLTYENRGEWHEIILGLQ